MSTTDPTDFVPPEDDGFSRARQVETRSVTSDVPPGLTDRFSLLRVLQAAERPSQAVVLRVRDLRSGTPDVPLVLKWYHRMHAPGPEVGRALLEAGRVPPSEGAPHLERLLETGRTDGHPYHLYRSHGETHLGDYQREHPGPMPFEQLKPVVAQLCDAVSFLHDEEIVHRDITPDNIMIQAHGDGPEITLIDLGAAVYRPDESARHFDWRGKPLYLAPEAASRLQSVSPEADWWSVGMVAAQLALGRPLMDEREDKAVMEALATREPDVDRLEHRRVRMLCTGLLTRDPENRWGARQVRDWLDGRSPDTAPRGAGPGRGAADPGPEPDPVTPFSFVGEQFTLREPLASALEHHHVAAEQMLADNGRRSELVGWLAQFAEGESEAERRVLTGLREALERAPSPELTVRLINWLGPRLEAGCWGMPLTVRGIRELSQAVRQNDGAAVQLAEHLRRHPGILTALAPRPMGEGLDDVADRWQSLRTGWPHLVRELLDLPDLRRLPRARHALRQTIAVDTLLLELAREPDRVEARLAHEAARFEGGLPREARVPWFNRLLETVDDDGLRRLRLVAAHQLTELAGRDAAARYDRHLQDEAERQLREDQDGAIAVLQRLDLPAALGWALLGATLVTFPYSFMTGLADVLGWASQDQVVVAWLWSLGLTPAVFAAELFTANWIRPPAYHPRHSLAGLIIERADRPASFALSRRSRMFLGALVLLAVSALVVGTVMYLPWLWPAVSTGAVVVWSVRRCLAWSRDGRGGRSRPAAPGGRTVPPQRSTPVAPVPSAGDAPGHRMTGAGR
ncbi:serine/threonine-protein kinase [Streptomyces sp. NRRL S-37]|uniref:serine/threonine-protein kinase n=1 Tax=Streptomyces sp. NRRL S-37 TaxID=1463903 RepID=UPI0004C9B4F2|nr:protein kinase [Streptomyces sp. NRRL S-37]